MFFVPIYSSFNIETLTLKILLLRLSNIIWIKRVTSNVTTLAEKFCRDWSSVTPCPFFVILRNLSRSHIVSVSHLSSPANRQFFSSYELILSVFVTKCKLVIYCSRTTSQSSLLGWTLLYWTNNIEGRTPIVGDIVFEKWLKLAISPSLLPSSFFGL